MPSARPSLAQAVCLSPSLWEVLGATALYMLTSSEMCIKDGFKYQQPGTYSQLQPAGAQASWGAWREELHASLLAGSTSEINSGSHELN